MDQRNGIAVAAPVAQAIAQGQPVVALESAVITHGLPRDAALEAVRRQSEACDRAGALPAVVAVFKGALCIGLTPGECGALASHPGAAKVSPWNLAAAMVRPGFGGTTVAATVRAAARVGLSVVSTGGIGGVHPGNAGQDVSADLVELSGQPVCVICAGPKSTLDAGATLERLETLGVPVIGWRSSLLAGFLSLSAGLRLSVRADTIDALATIARQHWILGGKGLVVTQPIDGADAIPRVELSAGGELAIRGPERTPAELSRLQARLGDRVIEANVALLERNAGLAAALAVALSQHPSTRGAAHD